MKKVLYLFSLMFLTAVLMSVSSCEPSPSLDSNKQLTAKQETLMREANSEVGMPGITHFQERKLMKQILELRDQENLVCYAYIVPEMTGKPVLLGKCIGYGLPYATQYTNPEKPVSENVNYGYTLPQADPNGLFMPSSAEGTWIMLIDPKTNTPHPVYCEPKVLITPFPLGV